MEFKEGVYGRKVRINDERWSHIIDRHPEMQGQLSKIEETLLFPDEVVESKSDNSVELYFRKYYHSPVGEKYLCVLVKVKEDDAFMLTAYFTETIKKGNLIWKKK